ncbi:hypothetical protein FA09DRAFT_332899 [Tilletiopsis washingtonensis]|uniref:Ubiquitin 3 binding protein But2 C-terminal domain-containing protein n=1 Tax=Tilletiopsis washingtonensis TaxID=58919 RepID=A0A316Z2U4_9BASI|nr:hypothetical protein FA09DRAFT_332899 [Tilletiopsis washingtonensis]PWN94495.1 hypothetical protein FA09DRAFT_332899 [Tilletiopsis washingtonensis]
MRYSLFLLCSLAFVLLCGSEAAAAPSKSDRGVARHRLNGYSLKAQRRLCEAVLQHYPKPKRVTTTTTTVTPLATATSTTSFAVATVTVDGPTFDDPERRGTFQLPENLRCFKQTLLRELCLEVFYGKVSSTSVVVATAPTRTSTVVVTDSVTVTTTQRVLPTDSTAYCGDSSCSCTVVQTPKRVITCKYRFKGAPSSFNVPCSGKLQARLIGGGRNSKSQPSLVESEAVQRPGATSDGGVFKVGEQFEVIVGGAGEQEDYPSTVKPQGGYGGGKGGAGFYGDAGGGSSDLLLQGARLLVAGGSGGASESREASLPPDVDHQCSGVDGCNANFLSGGGGGGLRGGQSGRYTGAGYGGSSLYNAGDLYIAQVNPTDPGFAPGVTLTYTCNA